MTAEALTEVNEALAMYRKASTPRHAGQPTASATVAALVDALRSARTALESGVTRRPLDPRPFRNRSDHSRWQDDGGDPHHLPLLPREGYELNSDFYEHMLTLDSHPYLAPDSKRYPERRPELLTVFRPREGFARRESTYLAAASGDNDVSGLPS